MNKNNLESLIEEKGRISTIKGENFSNEVLSNKAIIVCYFSKTIFTNCTFDDFNFASSSFSQCKFFDCTFSKVNLDAASFSQSSFENCNFIESEFIDAEIEATTFQSCEFKKGSFAQSYFESCNFSNTKFKDINFEKGFTGILEDSQISAGNWSIYFRGDFHFDNILKFISSI